MQEIFYIFSIDDPSVELEALRLGYSLVVNKRYDPDEDLLMMSMDSKIDISPFRRFFVLPDESFFSEILLADGAKKDDKKFRYIMDRRGAAAIDLTLYKKPIGNEVCVGSLAFQSRTYEMENDIVELRPPSFSKAFQRLRSYIKLSAQPISNGKIPKTVYAFPRALKLLKHDISCSPWPSLQIVK